MFFRPYKNSDAEIILSWIKNEREFRLWSADRYANYPISPSDITNNYLECEKSSGFFPFTLEDNGKVIGHIILRHPDNNKDIIRLGFIIVDSNIRGKGYGKAIINEAIKHAKDNLNAKEINLGVFANNTNAFECYKSVGFKVVGVDKNAYQYNDENWDCIEMILEK